MAHPGEDAVAHGARAPCATRSATASPYRREDGSYAFDNVWRFAIAAGA
jgi:hypothetical protein